MPRAALLALALLVAAGAWLVTLGEPPQSPPRDSPLGRASAGAPAAGPTDSAVLVGPPGDARRAAAVADASATSVLRPEAADDAPYARVRVHVVDLDGVPAPGVKVLAAPPRHVLNGFGETDARGMLEVLWRPRAWPAELLIELRGTDGRSLTGLRRFSVARGGVSRLELALTHDLLPRPFAEVDLRRAPNDAEPQRPASSSTETVMFMEEFGVSLDLEGLDELDWTEDPWESRRGAFEPDVLRDDLGAARFVSGSARGDFGDLIFESSEGESSMASDGRVAPERARAFGAVVDERGLPARGVRVAVEDRAGRTRAAARTDERGRYELRFVAGDVRLRAGGVERGSTAEVSLAAGAELEWDPTVRRLALVAGELPGSVAAAQIEASALVRAPGGDTLHISTLETVGGAPFELMCPPGASFTAHVTQIALPRSAVVERFDGLVPGVAWSPALAPPCEVSVAPRDGAPVGRSFPAASEARIFEVGGARGVRFPTWKKRGAALDFKVASGASELEIGTQGTFWSAPVPFDAPPFGSVDLGAVDFGPKGELVLPACEELRSVGEAAVVRGDAPYDAVVVPRARPWRKADTVIALPPGRYELRYDDGTRAPFALEPGARITVEWRPKPAAGEPSSGSAH